MLHSVWLTQCMAHSLQASVKPAWLLVYLSYLLFIFGSLLLHLLELPASHALEMSLFTFMFCEHDPGLLINTAASQMLGLKNCYKNQWPQLGALVALVRTPTLHWPHLILGTRLGKGH